ncbi:MarR family transcriptional regulator [Streptomyces sp. JJ66]|uniref:MarR family winged helix-turn-helix transcriptional regulator n=1 Tax=Streptomyces sp. JJ66 TaxID=2803843 RepID=UPI001C5825CC|nr:MarR family transcriptional regulator [Streptomyces sp. JJ66]MBW1603729.1 MarR family transcriptional regulator [Streptomyces sp. JJ66]
MERQQQHQTTPDGDVRRAAAALVRLWECAETAEGEALPRAQRRALAVVGAAERISPRVLGERLNAAASSVSRLCTRLESAGLLVRSQPSGDQRRTAYSLTAAGRRALAEVRARRLTVLTTALHAGDATTSRELTSAFRHVHRSLTALLTRGRCEQHLRQE